MPRYPHGPRVKVNVTADFIKDSIAANSHKCMISEAIKVAYPNATSVSTDMATIRFSDLDKGHRYVYVTPLSAAIALIAYDEGKKPNPFAFVLKNAHVTKAGVSSKQKERESKKRKAKITSNIPSRAILVGGDPSSGNLPRKIGGRRPPQLRMMRKFGRRVFAGASTERLKTIAEETLQTEKTDQ